MSRVEEARELEDHKRQSRLDELDQAVGVVLVDIERAPDQAALKALPRIKRKVAAAVEGYKKLSRGLHPGSFELKENTGTAPIFDFARRVNGEGIIKGPVEMWVFDDGAVNLYFVKVHGDFVKRMGIGLEAWPHGYMIAAREVADFLRKKNPFG